LISTNTVVINLQSLKKDIGVCSHETVFALFVIDSVITSLIKIRNNLSLDTPFDIMFGY
jgi:hypothetical protein